MSVRLIPWMLILAWTVAGCPRRDQPPESSYDPKLVDTAKQIADDANQPIPDQPDSSNEGAETEGECDRDSGGCVTGWICWDSYFCKGAGENACTAAGDKRCHKRCQQHSDCPSDTPRCKEVPIFKGSEHGVLEMFCVSGGK